AAGRRAAPARRGDARLSGLVPAALVPLRRARATLLSAPVSSAPAHLRLPAEDVPLAGEFDLVVAGGGAAGWAAAITAARLGLRTALVEEMPFLGGMSTGGAVGTFCGFYMQAADGALVPLVGGLPLAVADALRARGHGYGPVPFRESAALPYVPWGAKLLYEEWAAAEPNLRVWLHARVTHAVVEDGALRAVALSVRGGRIALAARAFVDATGDAELARLAGRSEEHTSELQSRDNLVCRPLREQKK